MKDACTLPECASNPTCNRIKTSQTLRVFFSDTAGQGRVGYLYMGGVSHSCGFDLNLSMGWTQGPRDLGDLESRIRCYMGPECEARGFYVSGFEGL